MPCKNSNKCIFLILCTYINFLNVTLYVQHSTLEIKCSTHTIHKNTNTKHTNYILSNQYLYKQLTTIYNTLTPVKTEYG